jgi:hypothetical protein
MRPIDPAPLDGYSFIHALDGGGGGGGIGDVPMDVRGLAIQGR